MSHTNYLTRFWLALGEGARNLRRLHWRNVQGWLWRLWLLDAVFWLGLMVLGNIAGPTWNVVAAVTAFFVHVAFTVHWVMMGKTSKKITTDGWENFLDGREELGEYEELGGKYEDADTIDEDD